MKNTILDYEKEEIQLDDSSQITYDAPNYFSKSIFISDLAKTEEGWDDYLDTYRMADNDRLERVSFELYGTPDYWDILFLINKRDPLFDMPYDYDTLAEMSTSFIDNYLNFIYMDPPLIGSRADELKEEYVNDALQDNEEYRFISVVKPSKISEFILLLKNKEYI